MGKYILRIVLVTILMWMSIPFFHKNVNAALTGTGTEKNPYVVSTFDNLKLALTTNRRSTGTTYIKISGTVIFKDGILVDAGKFSIYGDANAYLKKSDDPKATINNSKDYKYCLRVGVNSSASITFGGKGNGALYLKGERDYFENNKKISSGWLYVGSYGTVTLGSKVIAKEMINNDPSSGLSNFSVYGTLTVDGEIKDCKAPNGGAISVKSSGKVIINSTAKIHDCSSVSEGGAIWVKEKGNVTVNGGRFYNNSSGEEGGAIFVSGSNASAKILAGTFSKNTSGASAGAVFSGYGATLEIGSSSTAPTFSENKAKGSGGAIRANGGVTDSAGGKFYFYNGTVKANTSDKYGGGIALGSPGSKGSAVATISKATIESNTSKSDGGGIQISKGNKYGNSGVIIDSCNIKKNTASHNGGGIYTNAAVIIKNTDIADNTVDNSGGGISIDSDGSVEMQTGYIRNNKSSGGDSKGVYLNGILKIGNGLRVNEADTIYICQDKYIEIVKKFNYSASLYFRIKSKDTGTETKLIYVSDSSITAENFLYGNATGEENEYTNAGINKTVHHNSLSGRKLLRSGGMIRSELLRWVIISEKYTIYYNKNIDRIVTDMPSSQTKFYQESVRISSVSPKVEEYEIDDSKSWNKNANGTGQTYRAGAEYTDNKDLDLYAIWKRKLIITMDTMDRYYIVGQNIMLNNSEVLKKVKVYDNIDSGYKYDLKVIRIYDTKNAKDVAKETTGITNIEHYLDKGMAGTYRLYLHVRNDTYAKEQQETMDVHIMQPENEERKIRFISNDYLYTLLKDSVWNTNEDTTLLRNTFLNNQGVTFHFTENQIAEIRQFEQENNYTYSRENNKNFFDRFLKDF